MKAKGITGVVVLLLAAVVAVAASAKSSTTQPDSYSYKRGVEAYNNENYREAFEWFNKELAEHPDNGYAYYYGALIRYGNNEYGLSLSTIDKALKYLPKKSKEWRSAAYGTRALVHAEMRDTLTALADLAEAIKIDPTQRDYYKTRAGLNFERGDYAAAEADYRAMIKLDNSDGYPYVGIGRNALAQERWDEAIAQFNHALRLYPDYSFGYAMRARAYIGQEKWQEAVADIVEALELSADDMAFGLMQTLPTEAAEVMKLKLKVQMAKQPTNQFWPYCMALVAHSGNDYDEAIEYFEKANALDANEEILKYIAVCYTYKNDFARALDYADRALAMNPDDYDVVELKADILSAMGRVDECLAERDRYVAHYPEYPLAYFYRANDRLDARNYSGAIEDFNIAAMLDADLSNLPYLLMRRGDAYRLSGKEAESRKDYLHLLEVEKDSTLTSDSWTPFAYSGLGDKDKSIETMQLIVANDTTDRAGNLYNMACIYARVGDTDNAMKSLEDAVAAGYTRLGNIVTDYDMDALRSLPQFRQLIDSMTSAQNEATGGAGDAAADETSRTEIVEIPFTKEAGVTKVKCTVNSLPLHFVFDTGAASVTMSMVEANFMLKNDYIKPDDVIGSARYVDANGDVSEGTVLNLRNVNFGGLELDNVRASVVRNQKAPLLLGQSVLGRLGKIEIDNANQKLKITHKVTSAR